MLWEKLGEREELRDKEESVEWWGCVGWDIPEAQATAEHKGSGEERAEQTRPEPESRRQRKQTTIILETMDAKCKKKRRKER